MGRVTVAGGKVGMEAPSTGIALSTLAEGSIVKINENGSPVEFYVAKHDYESGLNGTGRTLLVRKDCYDSREWHTSYDNAYASSSIDFWLNGTYKGLFDSSVQSAMGTSRFYYTPSYSSDLTTLTRAIFLLSVTELGKAYRYANTEGRALPIASTLQIAYHDGSAVYQWTRSPYTDNSLGICCLTNGGSVGEYPCTGAIWSRPCFTLPATTLFDEETMTFKGVA